MKTYSYIVQVPADVLNVDFAAEGDPASTEPTPLRQRVRQRHAQEPAVALTHLPAKCNHF